MLKDKLDLGTIEHLDFEIEEKDEEKFGHLYSLAVSRRGEPAYCGIPNELGNSGHDPSGFCVGKAIPKGSLFCPHCGVKICPTCYAVSQYLQRMKNK